MRALVLGRLRSGALVLAAVVAGGCSTQVRVSEISNELVPGSAVDGLPFRALLRYEVTLYHLVGGTYRPVTADKRMVTLADPERLYVLRLSGKALSNDAVTVTLNPDNTIKKLVIDQKGQTKEALDKLTSVVGDIDKASKDRKTATEAATTAEEALRLSALQTKQAAELAALELAALPSDATAVTRKTAENKLAVARLTANQAARKADLPLPFPDVGT